MTTEEIDQRIGELEGQLQNPQPFPTEVYTRIVGYYRSVAHWNAGKREEYRHRREYREDSNRVAFALASPVLARAESYLLFTQPSCPRCPAMKSMAAKLTLRGREIDVSGDGYQDARQWNVTVTPTLVVVDDKGLEIMRITDVQAWPALDLLNLSV